MVAVSVKKPALPAPPAITLVLSRPVTARSTPKLPPAEDCYGCVDWYPFEEHPPEHTATPAASPLKVAGH
jgi:hypothetical protein